MTEEQPLGIVTITPCQKKIFIPFEEVLKYEVSDEEFELRTQELQARIQAKGHEHAH